MGPFSRSGFASGGPCTNPSRVHIRSCDCAVTTNPKMTTGGASSSAQRRRSDDDARNDEKDTEQEHPESEQQSLEARPGALSFVIRLRETKPLRRPLSRRAGPLRGLPSGGSQCQQFPDLYRKR